MSVTTTDNPITTTINNRDVLLQDYQIHLTGGGGDDKTPAPPNTDNRPPPALNPPGWPADHRGVPPYRPINTGLDRSQRPWGGNPVGDVFVFTMLHGVWLNSVCLPGGCILSTVLISVCMGGLSLIVTAIESSLALGDHRREDK